VDEFGRKVSENHGKNHGKMLGKTGKLLISGINAGKIWKKCWEDGDGCGLGCDLMDFDRQMIDSDRPTKIVIYVISNR